MAARNPGPPPRGFRTDPWHVRRGAAPLPDRSRHGPGARPLRGVPRHALPRDRALRHRVGWRAYDARGRLPRLSAARRRLAHARGHVAFALEQRAPERDAAWRIAL